MHGPLNVKHDHTFLLKLISHHPTYWQENKGGGFFTYIPGLRFSTETFSFILTEYNFGLTVTFIYIAQRNGTRMCHLKRISELITIIHSW